MELKTIEIDQIFEPILSYQHIAGVIDSDGSITISRRNFKRKRPTYTVLIQLTWILTKPTKNYIENLVRYFGGSYFISEKIYPGRFKNAKPIIKYCATGEAAQKLLLAISPNLWLKQQQAQNALTLLAYKKLDFRTRTQQDWDKFEYLYKSNKLLNSSKL